jgi:hypothetical protein
MSRFPRWFQISYFIACHWLLRYIASWLLVLAVTGVTLYCTWKAFADPRRDDGTYGHVTVDFGGQWICGKLLLRGEGHFLYERHHQWLVYQECYPPDPQPFLSMRVDGYRLEDWRRWPDKDKEAADLLASYLLPLSARDGVSAAATAVGAHEAMGRNRRNFGNPWFKRDAEKLMGWLLGTDDEPTKETYASCALPLAARDGFSAMALVLAGQDNLWTRRKMNRAAARRPGGNFYPPMHAFWYAPLAAFEPLTSYRVTTVVMLAMAFVAGLGVYKVTGGVIWWPIGSLLVLVFPGVASAQILGHSSIVLLTLLIWGYYYLQKNADVRGGALWGLMAYKPTWAVIYFFALLLARRWRAALAMGLCVVLQVLVTLPFVGVHSWQEWYTISRRGAKDYNKYKGWVDCARDMNSFPRKILIDWEKEPEQSLSFEMTIITYILIATFFEVTVRLTVLRTRGRMTWSPAGAAFLLTGVWMCCWRITYYDTMFVALPAALLLCTPSKATEPFFWRRSRLQWTFRGGTLTLPIRNFGWVCNPLVVVLLPFMAWEPSWYDVTWILPFFALLWIWAGWLWLRTPDVVETSVAGTVAPAAAQAQAA